MSRENLDGLGILSDMDWIATEQFLMRRAFNQLLQANDNKAASSQFTRSAWGVLVLDEADFVG
jgi:hypothetical protein